MMSFCYSPLPNKIWIIFIRLLLDWDIVLTIYHKTYFVPIQVPDLFLHLLHCGWDIGKCVDVGSCLAPAQIEEPAERFHRHPGIVGPYPLHIHHANHTMGGKKIIA